jgi:hypothetical protein
MEYDGAVLHGAVVLPEGSRVRKIGGRGYEYWVNGTNQDAFPDIENPLGGVWRLEVMPPQAARDDLFLTVLHPDWAGAPAPAVTRIAGSTQEGASVEGWVAMFAKTENELSESAYSVAMGGSQRHLVCDMEPGYSYRVYRNGNPTPLTTVTAGEDGIVEFVSPGGGSFQVTQGEYVPDNTPPTGSIEILGGDCLGAADVQLHLQAQDGQSGMAGGQMRFSNDGANWSVPQPYAESASWTLSAGEGAKTVYARFADAAGNWMGTPVSDGTHLDLNPPSGSFDIVEDRVEEPVVTLSCAASDAGCGGSAVSMCFSNDAVSWSVPQPVSDSVVWELDAHGNGTYSVYVCYEDALGHQTDPPLSDTVVLQLPPHDDHLPAIDNLHPADGGENIPLRLILAYMTQDLESGVDTTSVALLLDGVELDVEILPFTGGRYMVRSSLDDPLEPLTTYSAQATVSDLADPPNTATQSWSFTTGSIGVDTQPPAPPSGAEGRVIGEGLVELDWDPSPDPTVVGYQVYYGVYPQDRHPVQYLQAQQAIGAQVSDLNPAAWWFGVAAIDVSGQSSALSMLPEPLTITAGSGQDGSDEPPAEDPTGEEDHGNGTPGSIWPPGVLVDRPDAPLVVSDLRLNWTVRVYTVSGRLVAQHDAQTEGEDFTWNLRNGDGAPVAKALYLVRVYDASGKLANEGYYLRR